MRWNNFLRGKSAQSLSEFKGKIASLPTAGSLRFLYLCVNFSLASVMRVCVRAGLEISYCCVWLAELSQRSLP